MLRFFLGDRNFSVSVANIRTQLTQFEEHRQNRGHLVWFTAGLPNGMGISVETTSSCPESFPMEWVYRLR